MRYRILKIAQIFLISNGVGLGNYLHSNMPLEHIAAISKNSVLQKDQLGADSVLGLFNDKNRAGLYVTGEFTYWIAQEDGLQYALSGLLFSILNPNPLSGTGSAYSPNAKWDPGFKVGLGYLEGNYLWDLFVHWTWYHTQAKGAVDHGFNFDANQLWPQVSIPRYGVTAFGSGTAQWNLEYNTLDFSLGREFSLGKYFGLKPFSGLRAAWVDQKYNIQINGGGVNQELWKNKLDYKAVGLRSGLSSSWYFNKYLSLYNQASFSVLYGQLVDHVVGIRSLSFNGADNQTVANIRNSTHSVKSEMEISIGVRYETLYSRNDRYHFALDVAWEYLNWVNMNQFYIPVTGSDPFPAYYLTYQASGQFKRLNGDLGLMGFTLTTEFGF